MIRNGHAPEALARARLLARDVATRLLIAVYRAERGRMIGGGVVLVAVVEGPVVGVLPPVVRVERPQRQAELFGLLGRARKQLARRARRLLLPPCPQGSDAGPMLSSIPVQVAMDYAPPTTPACLSSTSVPMSATELTAMPGSTPRGAAPDPP